jgi:hypothetical protein
MKPAWRSEPQMRSHSVLLAGEIALVRAVHVGDQRLFGAALLARSHHDRGAVRVVGADVRGTVAAQVLEPHPDVGLDVFDQMAQVNVAVGVGQRTSNEQASHH